MSVDFSAASNYSPCNKHLCTCLDTASQPAKKNYNIKKRFFMEDEILIQTIFLSKQILQDYKIYNKSIL